MIKTLFSYEKSDNSLCFISPFEGTRLVMDILTDLGNYTSFKKNIEKAPTRLIKHAQEYIHNNLDKMIKIKDIAKECEVSREHLSRVFKEQLNESLSNYLSKRRIKRACRLLVSSNLSCKEIAARVGCNSAVSFNRIFKRVVKMTPGDVRSSGYSPQIL